MAWHATPAEARGAFQPGVPAEYDPRPQQEKVPRTSVPSARRPVNEPSERSFASSTTSPPRSILAAAPACRHVMTASSPPKVPPRAATRVAAGVYGLRPTTRPKYSSPFGRPMLSASHALSVPRAQWPPSHVALAGRVRRALPVPPVNDDSGIGAGVGEAGPGLGVAPAPPAAASSAAATTKAAARRGTRIRGRRPRPAGHPPRRRLRRPRSGQGSPRPGGCCARPRARRSAGARSCWTSPPAAP